MWNLMSRVGNAVSICKSHLQWDEDALLIYFAHEKTDQTQSRPGDPRHIYANPFQPAICPILSLGLFFLAIDITKPTSEFIFAGSNQYCRFHKSLRSRFADEELLGHSTGTFGTHSIRKGSATYASSGSTACPPYAAVSLRAGWATGHVSSLYLQYQSAGDQHVGRTVCGLNPNDTTFAVLPPRFKPDFDPNPLLETLFSNFTGVSAELRRVLTMTTASVFYHMEWLENNLPASHPLLSTPVFRLAYQRPISSMVECHTWKPGDAIQATGIPPHVSILLQMKSLNQALTQMPDRISAMLDQRVDGEGAFLRNASSEQVKHLISEAVREVIDNHNQRIPAPEDEGAPVVEQGLVFPSFFPTEKSKLSRLPPDFELPHGSLQNAWVCYLCWDKRKRLPPLRAVSGAEMRRSLASRFSRLRVLMEAIIKIAKQQNLWVEPEDERTAMQILNSVDLSQVISVTTHKHRTRRLDQLSWTTLAKDYYASLKQQRREADQDVPHD